MDAIKFWYFLFGLLFFTYLCIQLKTDKKIRYFVYFLAGALLGYYFDVVSVANGYYHYHQYWPTILNVPFTVTLAEGFSAAITIYLFEKSKLYN